MMEVKREGWIVSFEQLDEGEARSLQITLDDYIKTERSQLQVRVWNLKDGSFTVDVYYESEYELRRLEEWLNANGYVLRLTPKKTIMA